MQIVKWLIGLGLVGTIIVVALVAFVLNDRSDLSQYDAYWLDEGPAPVGTPSVQMLGITTMLISDGTTNVMIDGFFTKPGLMEVTGQIGPDEARINAALASIGNPRLDVITPVHSHYDHAMDTPLVAMKTGAVMLGSSSTVNIGRGLNMPEDRMIEVVFETPYRFGAFTLTFVKSEHVPLGEPSMVGPITEPLVPPRRLNTWKQGEAYSILIAHDNGHTALVQGSAGFVPGALQGHKVDTVLLCIGGVDGQGPAYFDQYWSEIVGQTNPSLVVPVHWDDLFAPYGGPLRANPKIADDLDANMALIIPRAEKEGRALQLMQFGATLWLD